MTERTDLIRAWLLQEGLIDAAGNIIGDPMVIYQAAVAHGASAAEIEIAAVGQPTGTVSAWIASQGLAPLPGDPQQPAPAALPPQSQPPQQASEFDLAYEMHLRIAQGENPNAVRTDMMRRYGISHAEWDRIFLAYAQGRPGPSAPPAAPPVVVVEVAPPPVVDPRTLPGDPRTVQPGDMRVRSWPASVTCPSGTTPVQTVDGGWACRWSEQVAMMPLPPLGAAANPPPVSSPGYQGGGGGGPSVNVPVTGGGGLPAVETGGATPALPASAIRPGPAVEEPGGLFGLSPRVLLIGGGILAALVLANAGSRRGGRK